MIRNFLNDLKAGIIVKTENEYPYATHLNIYYEPLELIDVPALVGHGFVVPKGIMHRPRAPQRTVILMVEGAGIVPTGDS